MTSERWRKIEALHHQALELPQAERAGFLEKACGDDRELREQVHELIEGGGPAIAPGAQLGPYRIEGPIGAGAMGQVYKARDTRLQRSVAIKVVTRDLSGRFEREARAISALNHPNICTVHDVGPDYLVMELVEGQTLAERMKGGPVPLEDALEIARQIAEALAAAHEQGIIHRDLKPANIKITPGGVVKVLDFGLAKVVTLAQARSADSTQALSLTQVGTIVGTPAYMAPEQASGKPVDRRADIWAFGVVLYEMLTGTGLFRGETISEVLAAVLTVEPDWGRVPAKARPLLRRCLERDPNQRLRDAGDSRFLLQEATPAAAATTGRTLPWKLAAAACAVIAVGAVALSLRPTERPASPVLRFTVELERSHLVPLRGAAMALSPDGARLVYVTGPDSNPGLAILRLDQPKPRVIPGTEGAEAPFFSPDGTWVGFLAQGKLKKTDTEGSAPVTICDVPGPRGASWGDDGNIVFCERSDGGLFQVSSAGGTPTRLTTPDRARGEDAHRYPQVLPGAKAFLFSNSLNFLTGEGAIDVQSLKTGERKQLVRSGAYPRYLPSGHLVYWHKGVLFAASMDPDRLVLTGPASPVLEDVAVHRSTGTVSYAFSATGLFVYVPIEPEDLQRPIEVVEESGASVALPLPKGRYTRVRVSPEGTRVAYTMAEGVEEHIWIYDWRTRQQARFPFLSGNSDFAVWSPDGKWLLFSTDAEKPGPGIYAMRAEGSGEARRLVEGADVMPWSISPQSDQLMYSVVMGEKEGTYRMALHWTADGPEAGGVERISSTVIMKFSADGKWLAYDDLAQGTPHVFVRAAMGPGRWLVGQGYDAAWSPAGGLLFFRQLPGFRVAVARYTSNGDHFVAGPPRVWSDKPVDTFDVMPDGKRAVVIPAGPGQKEATRVTFLVNFMDELRRRVPAGK